MRRISFSWLQRLDTLGHKLRLPKWLFGRVCDEYERRLQQSFDWGYQYPLSTLNYTAGSSQTMNVSITRRRHDA